MKIRLSSAARFLLALVASASSVVAQNSEPFDGAADAQQARELIERLDAETGEGRRQLMARIRKGATPGATHPPTESSTRTDLLPFLELALGNEDKDVRSEAICTLCYMKCKEAFPILELAIVNRDPIIRYYACMGIEWLADVADLRPRAVTALEKARDRPGESLNVRMHASSALAEIGVKQDAKIFLDALRDPRGNEALAARELARMGRKDTIELMIGRLRTAVPSGDHWLGKALEKLTGQEFGTDADAWQDWFDAHRSELPEQLH